MLFIYKKSIIPCMFVAGYKGRYISSWHNKPKYGIKAKIKCNCYHVVGSYEIWNALWLNTKLLYYWQEPRSSELVPVIG